MQPETCSQPHSRQPHVANTLPSFCPIAFRPCRRPCGSSNAASKHAMLATAPRSLTPTNPSHTPRLPAAERRASVARRVSVWITTPTPHAPAGASECHSPPSNIPTPPHALMPNALMPTRFSPPVSLQRCLSTNAESRMPNAARYQSLTPQPRSIDVANSPNTTLRARTTLEICTRGPRLCAQSMPSAPILLASHQTFCENAHWWPVTSHQVPLFALSGGSQLAESTATTRQARPMIERPRTWSQPNHPPAVLDNFGGGPPVPGGRNPKALVDHATMSSASSTSPSPPIPVRQPLTHSALRRRAGRSSHARGN